MKNVESILNSLDGMQRAEIGPFLEGRIVAQWQKENRPAATRWYWRLAIALLVLMALNMITIKRLRSGEEKPGAQAVANEYTIALPQTY